MATDDVADFSEAEASDPTQLAADRQERVDAPAPQVDEDQQAALNEIKSYPFYHEGMDSLPAEQLTQLMSAFDGNMSTAAAPVQQPPMAGFPVQQQPEVPQRYVAPPPAPQGMTQQVDLPVNDWDDPEKVDPVIGSSFKGLSQKLQQMETQNQQLIEQMQAQQMQFQAQQVQQQFDSAVDSLASDVYGQGFVQNPQQQWQRQQLMQTAANMEQNYASRGMAVPPLPELVRRAARALGSQPSGNLQTAQTRNGQITSGPTRAGKQPITNRQQAAGEAVRSIIHEATGVDVGPADVDDVMGEFLPG